MNPTLQASEFSDPDIGDTQFASEWVISQASNNQVVVDTGEDTTDKASYDVSELQSLTIYRWAVRYEDSHGNWSDYSTSALFTTGQNTFQPDLWIADWGKNDWRGKTLYNANGDNQSFSEIVKPKKVKKFKIILQNNGTAADTFILSCRSVIAAGFVVEYFEGAKDISPKIRDGSFEVTLKPRKKRLIFVSIRATKAVESNVIQNCLITATSLHDSSKLDAVQASVTTP
ncbi:MAG: hypothetical protein QM796_04880 [Chthoniobacteraceae bacterium]